MRYPWAVPGAKVVCIKEGLWNYYLEGEVHPFKGQIFTIREVTLKSDGDVYLRFKELRNPPIRRNDLEVEYAAYRFRPLHTQETDVELFAHLLTPSPNSPMLPQTETHTI